MTAPAADNPVLADWGSAHGGAPAFDKIKVEHFPPALDAAMAALSRRDRRHRRQPRAAQLRQHAGGDGALGPRLPPGDLD